ncbi:Chloride channel, voltage gated [Metarhizium album ARSEF 1941]|uniref:Chloride channel protein n=1 Tax=Metarhizium album (strain ARSEF 1941) TaxID=1081103 RepID=A0A0B2WUL8_METAS|nr:Chloride channel, voltage gated [Metarhizium album ARSEF 1941]KHN97304.1 Chloride channel, voltage gated [Metarhizium album ARSEF 1941]
MASIGNEHGTEPHPSETTPLLPHSSRDRDVESLHPSRRANDRLILRSAYRGGGGGDDDDDDETPYKDYATIDWLQDLVKDNTRHGIRDAHVRQANTTWVRVAKAWDSASGWVAAFVVGLLTACVAFVVDVSVETVADWKDGHCKPHFWLNRRACSSSDQDGTTWMPWSGSFPRAYLTYVAFALLFGIIAAAVTTTTKMPLPPVVDLNVADKDKSRGYETKAKVDDEPRGKVMYMAAGSGIPEIKTILCGFVIPHYLTFKVLAVKAIGATFAVATGMCLGKEGPFVHISTCVGHLVAKHIPKYAQNQRKMREMLSVACSAGLSVAFGAPIGGVLFSYEEISTYFPRRVLWRSFLCSLVAAATLKALDPTGTGKLVLFETKYGVDYDVVHYFVFIFLGICGGIFGGVFCSTNFLWSKTFRKQPWIKNSPLLEVCIVVLVTAVLQYPNPLIRQTGDIIMERLLVDCNDIKEDWICVQEAKTEGKGLYYAWLISGTFIKLTLTIITFGCKVPSGIIIPALDAGALFGRMVGQLVPDISPGIFAMVGSAAFLAGVSRMTVSLAVIMFELTGEVNFIPPFMAAILTAKWVADSISADGVYDLSQHIMSHPFLDSEQAVVKLRALKDGKESPDLDVLIPPERVMEQITIHAGPNHQVIISDLRAKLIGLSSGGLFDMGLVIVNERGVCTGYICESSIAPVLRFIGQQELDGNDLISFADGSFEQLVDRSPLTISTKAPLEYAVEMFGKLGLSHLVVVDEDTAQAVGLIGKKRLLRFLGRLE